MTATRESQRSCAFCKTRPAMARKLARRPPLRPIITKRPFEKIFYDITYLPQDPVNADRYLLVLIDHYSKFCWVQAFATREAKPIGDFIDSVFRTEGAPSVAVSDNGTEFKNALVGQVLKDLGVSEAHGYLSTRRPRCCRTS